MQSPILQSIAIIAFLVFAAIHFVTGILVRDHLANGHFIHSTQRKGPGAC